MTDPDDILNAVGLRATVISGHVVHANYHRRVAVEKSSETNANTL